MNRIGTLLLVLLSLVGLLSCSKYPLTAEQSGKTSLLLRGRNIGVALRTFHTMNDQWPRKLSELVHEGLLTKDDLLYPKTFNLGDRRDLLKITDQIEWIYLRPQEDFASMPILLAPLPYTSSMGRRLQDPERIVVTQDSIVSARKEYEIAEVLRALAGT